MTIKSSRSNVKYRTTGVARQFQTIYHSDRFIWRLREDSHTFVLFWYLILRSVMKMSCLSIGEGFQYIVIHFSQYMFYLFSLLFIGPFIFCLQKLIIGRGNQFSPFYKIFCTINICVRENIGKLFCSVTNQHKEEN